MKLFVPQIKCSSPRLRSGALSPTRESRKSTRTKRTIGVYEGTRLPPIRTRHRRHSQVQIVFATRARPAEPERVGDSRRALIFNLIERKNSMNPNPTTFDLPTGLSNLLSAYDEAHWEIAGAELKANSGVLKRGSVLSAVGGKLELVSSGNQATAFGVLLDEEVDTAVPY